MSPDLQFSRVMAKELQRGDCIRYHGPRGEPRVSVIHVIYRRKGEYYFRLTDGHQLVMRPTIKVERCQVAATEETAALDPKGLETR